MDRDISNAEGDNGEWAIPAQYGIISLSCVAKGSQERERLVLGIQCWEQG